MNKENLLKLLEEDEVIDERSENDVDKKTASSEIREFETELEKVMPDNVAKELTNFVVRLGQIEKIEDITQFLVCDNKYFRMK